MLKQITFTALFISSLSFAQIPLEKKDELLQQVKQEMLEKHLAEKDKALNDLRIAGIGTAIASYFFMCVMFIVGSIEESNASKNAGGLLAIAGMGTNFYSSYKAHQGLKHLYYPDHPKPEETPEKSKTS